MRKPTGISTCPKAVILKATSWAVTVVPMFEPMMIPRLWRNESVPALTSPMVMIVVAALDWTRAVTPAPRSAPRTGRFVTLPRILLKLPFATARISREKFSIP